MRMSTLFRSSPPLFTCHWLGIPLNQPLQVPVLYGEYWARSEEPCSLAQPGQSRFGPLAALTGTFGLGHSWRDICPSGAFPPRRYIIYSGLRPRRICEKMAPNIAIVELTTTCPNQGWK